MIGFLRCPKELLHGSACRHERRRVEAGPIISSTLTCHLRSPLETSVSSVNLSGEKEKRTKRRLRSAIRKEKAAHREWPSRCVETIVSSGSCRLYCCLRPAPRCCPCRVL